VPVLLKNGAAKDAKNADGQIPADLATDPTVKKLLA
jgi:hypothetical protein